MAKPELCRHDIETAYELEHALINAAFFSRDAVKTRTRDIDRRTESMLRKTLDGRRIGTVRVKIMEDSLIERKAMVLSGPGSFLSIGIVLDTKLTALDRNKLIMHSLGLIATGNLGEWGLHFEPDSKGDQTEEDRVANQWAADLARKLSAGRSKGSIFAKGIERAVAA